MSQASAGSLETLNRVLSVLVRSLPMYLAEAGVYTHDEHSKAAAVLANIVSDQRALAARISELIDQRRGEIQLAPLEDRTALNFLDLEYLLPILIDHQKRDIATLEQCVRSLVSDPQAKALAEEALGSARAHLEALEDAALAGATSS